MMAESFQGLGVSSGVAVGHAVLHEPEALPIVPVPVPPERVDEEIERFERVREQARGEIEGLRDRTLAILGERYAGMLDAQLLILDDPTLVSKTVQRIRVGRVSARWALKEVVADFIRRFDAVDDLYLRERGGDLDDVHRRLQRLLGGARVAAGHAPEGPTIMVAHALGPSDAVALSTGDVVGLVTDVGGRTSHTAILAQALSLPAVVGLHDISERVRPGDPIIVNGDLGEIVWLPDPAAMDAARERREVWLAREREMAVVQPLPAQTRDAVEIDLRANIEFPEQVDRARRLGAEGIGLYRSEFLFLSHAPKLPTEDEHTVTTVVSRRRSRPTRPSFARWTSAGKSISTRFSTATKRIPFWDSEGSVCASGGRTSSGRSCEACCALRSTVIYASCSPW